MLASNDIHDDMKKDLVRLYSEGKFEEAKQVFKKAEEKFKKEPKILGEIISAIQQKVDEFLKLPNSNIEEYLLKLYKCW